MLWFAQPSCPAKAFQRSLEAYPIPGSLHLLGPHRELAWRVFCELLELEVQNFVIWADLVPPAAAKAVLHLELAKAVDAPGGDVDLSQPESYLIAVKPEAVLQIQVTAADEAGLKHGLIALVANFFDQDRIRSGWEYGYPDFPVRGIVEGFYGTPWTHADRLEMLAFLERYRCNTYFYAPKDDVYHREKWRELYPPGDAAKLRELVADAKQRGITWIYGIGPGLTLEFSNAAACQLVLDKVQSVADMGVQQFALLLDDIPETMLFATDRERFASMAAAHIHLANLLWDSLRQHVEDPTLYLCPTEYCQAMEGNVDPEYLRQLGAGLDPDIGILWTGPSICSASIGTDDVDFVQERLGRPPVYWDNYPVNDCAMVKDLHIGSYCGRSGELAGKTAGFLANPMPLPEASKVALATMADYLWYAGQYDPEQSWLAALRQAVGAPGAFDLEMLGRVCQLSPLRPQPEQPLEQLSAGERLAYAIQSQEAALRLAGFCGNQALLRDIRPWLEDLHHWGRIIQCCEAADWAQARQLLDWVNPNVQTIGPTVVRLYGQQLAAGSGL